MTSIRCLLLPLLIFLCMAAAEAAPSVDANLLPPGSADRGEAVEKMLGLLPLMPWSQETEAAWKSCLTAIETETNSYWATRNLGDFVGALAVPNVPHNAATAAMLDRAVTASKRWAGQGAPLVVAKGLLWYGDFDRAFAAYPPQSTPEPLVEFAFETLADKPELGKENRLWQLALGRMGNEPSVQRRAVHALAFSGRMAQALAIAAQQASPSDRAEYDILAARYARYGGHEADFIKLMGDAAESLKLLPKSASSLPMLRDLLEETDAPPTPTLPDQFWKTIEAWAGTLPPDLSSAAIAEIAGASAWAGRSDATALLPTLAGTSWQDSARMRVACGWLWNGKHEQAAQCADAIKDPEWRAMAGSEMAYLSHQLSAGEAAK